MLLLLLNKCKLTYSIGYKCLNLRRRRHKGLKKLLWMKSLHGFLQGRPFILYMVQPFGRESRAFANDSHYLWLVCDIME